MADPAEALIGDFVAWLASGARSYDEVMEIWRTSCPRLTIWEDAIDRGLVRRERDAAGEACVAVTAEGRAWLAARAE